MDTDQRPTPRTRSRRGPRCIRDGCGRTQAKGHSHCTQICRLLDDELARLECMCRAARPGTRSTEAWTALVGVADAWSEYVMVRGILNHVADRAQSLALAGPTAADTAAGRKASASTARRSSLGRNLAAGDAQVHGHE
jgi:hypothetical protein